MEEKLLRIKGLCLSYGNADVVAEFDLSLKKGETLCLVGESGCGKSTLLKGILGIPEICVTEGSIRFDGEELTALGRRGRRRILGERIGFVPQNPGGSFNPIRNFEKQFRETLQSHGRSFDRREVLACLESLHLPEGAGILKSCPYEMSGGMNQRIAIALAMLLRPELLLCDEPTSALDVMTQRLVAEAFVQLREQCGTAILMATHNLGVAAKLADTVAIMYGGRLVEYGSAQEVLERPAHPCTQSLLRAVPDLSGALPEGLEGYPPREGASRDGCGFAARCPRVGAAQCREPYRMKEIRAGHFACCQEKL